MFSELQQVSRVPAIHHYNSLSGIVDTALSFTVTIVDMFICSYHSTMDV